MEFNTLALVICDNVSPVAGFLTSSVSSLCPFTNSPFIKIQMTVDIKNYLDENYGLFINGEFVKGHSDETLEDLHLFH
jgi:hypothetical protein